MSNAKEKRGKFATLNTGTSTCSDTPKKAPFTRNEEDTSTKNVAGSSGGSTISPNADHRHDERFFRAPSRNSFKKLFSRSPSLPPDAVCTVSDASAELPALKYPTPSSPLPVEASSGERGKAAAPGSGSGQFTFVRRPGGRRKKSFKCNSRRARKDRVDQKSPPVVTVDHEASSSFDFEVDCEVDAGPADFVYSTVSPMFDEAKWLRSGGVVSIDNDDPGFRSRSPELSWNAAHRPSSAKGWVPGRKRSNHSSSSYDDGGLLSPSESLSSIDGVSGRRRGSSNTTSLHSRSVGSLASEEEWVTVVRSGRNQADSVATDDDVEFDESEDDSAPSPWANVNSGSSRTGRRAKIFDGLTKIANRGRDRSPVRISSPRSLSPEQTSPTPMARTYSNPSGVSSSGSVLSAVVGILKGGTTTEDSEETGFRGGGLLSRTGGFSKVRALLI